MVSYVRARAGGLRIDCEVGVMTRTERVVVLGAGVIAGQWWPPAVLIVLAAIGALTIVTTVQRVLHVRRELEKR
jgi:CDP-diacylglycerol--glycerol-3-phosphate 3-phosphatidyltransferase